MAYVIDDIHLTDEMEQNAEIGPLFSTTILPAANGVETPNQNWLQAKHQGTFNYGMMAASDLLTIKNFQLGRRGMARGWLLKDWSDYAMIRQQIALGTGAATVFPIIKTYADSVNPYLRVITRPVSSTLQVWVNNVLKTLTTDYTFSPTTGLTFLVAPPNGQAIEVACEFDMPVRFSNDYMPFHVVYAGAIEVPAFGLIEILEYVQT